MTVHWNDPPAARCCCACHGSAYFIDGHLVMSMAVARPAMLDTVACLAACLNCSGHHSIARFNAGLDTVHEPAMARRKEV